AERLQEIQDFLDGLEEEDHALSQEIGEQIANNIGNAGEGNGNNNENIGVFKKLPSSFRGGPRYNKKNYYNSMSMVGILGKPCLFITMTCNPEWPEIKPLMVEGICPKANQPLASKVFEGKVKELLNIIDKGGLFGTCGGYTGVIEFQKRGLPHLHLLVWLHPDDKLNTQ